MNIQEATRLLIQQLQTIYEEREAINIADITLESITGYSKSERILFKTALLSNQQEHTFMDCITRLLQQEPIQYIIGKTWFYKYPFYVNNQVLIPRPETEELVKKIIEENKQSATTIIDIGTGSGCIAISLKKNLSASVEAIDISKEALNVAQINAKELKADVQFKQVNILDKEQWKSLGMYDMIVSNPPYIMQKEQQDMHYNVIGFEPHIALFVADNNALIFYNMIALFGLVHLKKNGSVWVEINENLFLETMQLFESIGYQTSLYQDLQGKNRMIHAKLFSR